MPGSSSKDNSKGKAKDEVQEEEDEIVPPLCIGDFVYFYGKGPSPVNPETGAEFDSGYTFRVFAGPITSISNTTPPTYNVKREWGEYGRVWGIPGPGPMYSMAMHWDIVPVDHDELMPAYSHMRPEMAPQNVALKQRQAELEMRKQMKKEQREREEEQKREERKKKNKKTYGKGK